MSSCFQTFLLFCKNNCFHTAIAGAFVHIRNFLVQLSARQHPPASSRGGGGDIPRVMYALDMDDDIIGLHLSGLYRIPNLTKLEINK